MKKSMFYWQVVGFFFTIALGVLLHFLFDMTNQNIIAALFSAVNESIWEHMKLLFYPTVLFAVLESRFIEQEYETFWCVKLKGILLGLVLIPMLYYTYTGIWGTSVDWFNIAIFVIAVGVVYWVETRRFQEDKKCLLRTEAAVGVLCVIALVFTVLTFVTPKIPLFEDSVTGTYGFYELK